MQFEDVLEVAIHLRRRVRGVGVDVIGQEYRHGPHAFRPRTMMIPAVWLIPGVRSPSQSMALNTGSSGAGKTYVVNRIRLVVTSPSPASRMSLPISGAQ